MPRDNKRMNPSLSVASTSGENEASSKSKRRKKNRWRSRQNTEGASEGSSNQTSGKTPRNGQTTKRQPSHKGPEKTGSGSSSKGQGKQNSKGKRSHERRLRQRARQKERREEKKNLRKLGGISQEKGTIVVLENEAGIGMDNKLVGSLCKDNEPQHLSTPILTFLRPVEQSYSEPKTVNLILDSFRRPVPSNVVRVLNTVVMRRGEYCVLEGVQDCNDIMARVNQALPGCTVEHQICIDRIRSVRRALILKKCIRRHQQLQRFGKQIERMYNQDKKDILTISKTLDFSPVNCFRHILSARSFQKAQIKRFTKLPDTLPAKRDREQMWLAANNDTCSVQNEHKVLEEAKDFELALEQLFRVLHVQHTTEAQLHTLHAQEVRKYEQEMEDYEERVNKSGAAAAGLKPEKPRLVTPDLLFPKGSLTLNGSPVNWIDAKSYFGVDGFLTKKMNAQVQKYFELWGPGAVVFKLGFAECLAEAVNTDHCMLVDYLDLVHHQR